MTAQEILNRYITFFEKRGHLRIANSSLVPENDPTTLFTSSGMQPLVPYLLGEEHPQGKRLVNVQNCFRAQDIDEIGDNRHTTFFRMLGNWSLGDYFKKEQIPWFWEFLTAKEEGLGLDPSKLYVTVFSGYDSIPKDEEAYALWSEIFLKEGLKPNERIFEYGIEKNWWSRSGIPETMPVGEPGGPDTEVFYKFDDVEHDPTFGKNCHVNCDCGRYLEIGNSVFMQFKKTENGFEELPQKNVDFGGGLERLVAATENKADVFTTSLFHPIIESVERLSGKKYQEFAREMRIVLDHFVAAVMIIANGVIPSNKEQGYVLRRLIRRGFDNIQVLGGENVDELVHTITEQYKDTDPYLVEQFEKVKLTILEEIQKYVRTQKEARKFIRKKYKTVSSERGAKIVGGLPTGKDSGDELKGVTKILAEDAFILYTTHGLSPTQIKSLGYQFDDQDFARLMEEHQSKSRMGAGQKFAGGLADHEELTIKGHTATHLLHQALRDVLGNSVHQTGSNITTERLRFDFSYPMKLTEDQIQKVEEIVRSKIEENLPVFYKMMPVGKAKEIGAIGLFDGKYEKTVKVYFIGGSREEPEKAYSKEFCGGPHVDFTGRIKSFKIVKEEGVSKEARRIYAVVQ